MTTAATFAPLLERFFTQRLMQQRQASPHTISSYRDTFRQFLKFAQLRLHKLPSRLNLEEIDAPLVVAFLDELEKYHGLSVRSRNLRLAKALIRGMSESIRALQTDSANAKIAIRAALKTDDAETIAYALSRSVRVLDARPYPTAAGIQTVLDEIGKEAKGKTLKFEDFVDMRVLRELEKEGFFKQVK